MSILLATKYCQKLNYKYFGQNLRSAQSYLVCDANIAGRRRFPVQPTAPIVNFMMPLLPIRPSQTCQRFCTSPQAPDILRSILHDLFLINIYCMQINHKMSYVLEKAKSNVARASTNLTAASHVMHEVHNRTSHNRSAFGALRKRCGIQFCGRRNVLICSFATTSRIIPKWPPTCLCSSCKIGHRKKAMMMPSRQEPRGPETRGCSGCLVLSMSTWYTRLTWLVGVEDKINGNKIINYSQLFIL